jgi:hypothetical protein
MLARCNSNQIAVPGIMQTFAEINAVANGDRSLDSETLIP